MVRDYYQDDSDDSLKPDPSQYNWPSLAQMIRVGTFDNRLDELERKERARDDDETDYSARLPVMNAIRRRREILANSYSDTDTEEEDD